MDGPKRFSFFLLGLGVGVGLGMMFAPRGGSEIRPSSRYKGVGGRDLLVPAEGYWVDKGRRVMEGLAGDNPTRPKGMAGDNPTKPKVGDRLVIPKEEQESWS